MLAHWYAVLKFSLRGAFEFQAYELDLKDDGYSELSFFVPKELASGLVNNKKENYKFW